MLPYIVPIVLIVVLVVPHLWVRRVIRRHQRARPDYPGTGGELARHLLDEAGLYHVTVETCPDGEDHYNPEIKAVRLSPAHLEGRSLAAVTIAAHEVGHALQDRDGYPMLRLRQGMAHALQLLNIVGTAVMVTGPVVGALFGVPRLGLAPVVAGGLMVLAPVLFHLVTLPVEFDASFSRALPVLDRGRYLPPADMPHARSLLRAAALTYVAGSARSVLNVLVWLRYLLR